MTYSVLYHIYWQVVGLSQFPSVTLLFASRSLLYNYTEYDLPIHFLLNNLVSVCYYCVHVIQLCVTNG